MRYLIILTILICTPSFGFTYDSVSLKQKQIMQVFLHKVLQYRESPWGVTALSMIAQCKDNAPISVYGGFTSNNNKTSINENSLFEIGSVTKSFISVVILQLAQEYKLNLDSPKIIEKYFPEYPKWGAITIRQLLNMTSGIAGVSTGEQDDIFKKYTAYQYENYISPTDILNGVHQLPLHFKSGTQWEYSNTNYILLGLLIQKITHHSTPEEVQKRIIDRLAMHHTYFPINKLQSIRGINQINIVHGYAFYPKGHMPYSFMKFGQDTVNFSFSRASYAGAIVSTPEDINLYLHALYKPSILLNQTQLKEFTTLVSKKNGQPFSPEKSPGNVGFGLGVFGYYSKTQNSMVYFYQGSMDGSQFYYFYIPDTKMYLTFGINSRSDVISEDDSMALIDAMNKQCTQYINSK